MQITLLCKVVDNFGDIGVVYRLAKQLKKIQPQNQINLVTDDLFSFQKICNSVDPQKALQTVEGLNVYDWKAEDFCHEAFSRNDGELMPVILECFQCGRPDWMERILFEEKLQRTVHIIMIDYLTAEQYAEDFHCLQSLTRSAKVQKVNFMPGFTERTGGLIIDGPWAQAGEWKAEGPILVFTYERDWSPLAAALGSYCAEHSCKVLAAQGRGQESFVEAWKKRGDGEGSLQLLPYMNQNEWDSLMQGCRALVIRGEESMSRACLSGIPFIWHAYPQSDEYQLVKVKALLQRMRRHFSEADFSVIERVWLAFNSPESEIGAADFQAACKDFFNSLESLVTGFAAFAESLRKNGDLCVNLMTFIEKFAII